MLVGSLLLETVVYPVDIRRLLWLIYCETYSRFQAHAGYKSWRSECFKYDAQLFV